MTAGVNSPAVFFIQKMTGKDCMGRLNKDSVPIAVAFPEFFRRAALFLFEQPVKVGDVVESAIVRHFRDGLGSINQQTGRMTQSHFQEAIHKRDAGAGFEEAAKGNIGHICQLGHFGERDLFLKILVHIIDGLADPAAVVRIFSIIKGRIGKRMHVPRNRKIMKDRH